MSPLGSLVAHFYANTETRRNRNPTLANKEKDGRGIQVVGQPSKEKQTKRKRRIFTSQPFFNKNNHGLLVTHIMKLLYLKINLQFVIK